jgi:hypothetical protein
MSILGPNGRPIATQAAPTDPKAPLTDKVVLRIYATLALLATPVSDPEFLTNRFEIALPPEEQGTVRQVLDAAYAEIAKKATLEQVQMMGQLPPHVRTIKIWGMVIQVMSQDGIEERILSTYGFELELPKVMQAMMPLPRRGVRMN